MFTDYENRKANAELKDILSKFHEDYQITSKASRAQYMNTLPAGRTTPREGVIYGDAIREDFNNRCAEYRARVRKTIDPVIESLKKHMTQAPDAECASVLSLLNMRDHITKTEVDDLVERYGSNPQAYRTIQSIAHKHDISLEDDDLESRVADIETLRDNLNDTLSMRSAEGGHGTEGFLAMMCASIDQNFPVEE